MITLHQFEISPFCDKIRRVLHWKRQPYEIREVLLSKAFTSVRKVNRIGKLPCLEIDGRFVADSTDIAHLLEERFPDPPLLPKDPKQRALCHVLEDWADESLYFYEMRLRFGIRHNAEKWIPILAAHDPPWMKRVAGFAVPFLMRRTLSAQGLGRKPDAMVVADLERHLAALGALLAGSEWLVGDALTLADIAVFAQLYCVRGAREGAERIEASRPLAEWMERVDRATAPPA